MLAYLRLAATLVLFTTAFTCAGFAGAVDSGRNPWYGMLSGGAVGIFLGLFYVGTGAIRGWLLDAIYPPELEHRRREIRLSSSGRPGPSISCQVLQFLNNPIGRPPRVGQQLGTGRERGIGRELVNRFNQVWVRNEQFGHGPRN